MLMNIQQLDQFNARKNSYGWTAAEGYCNNMDFVFMKGTFLLGLRRAITLRNRCVMMAHYSEDLTCLMMVLWTVITISIHDSFRGNLRKIFALNAKMTTVVVGYHSIVVSAPLFGNYGWIDCSYVLSVVILYHHHHSYDSTRVVSFVQRCSSRVVALVSRPMHL